MKVFHISHRGKSHIRDATPLQDASASFSDGKISIVAVADGHDGDDYFRSDIGSRLAVDTAVDILKELATNVDPNTLAANRKVVMDNLKKTIIEEWRKRVREHLDMLPFFEEELNGISSKTKSRIDAGRVEPVYGATLLASIITKNFWIAVQIGDGRIWAAKDSGEWKTPMPEDPDCIGNATTSLCDRNAEGSMRAICSRILPKAVFLGTDGLSDTFLSDADAEKLFSCFVKDYSDNPDKAGKEISEHMMFRSYKGSSDDISLAFQIND